MKKQLLIIPSIFFLMLSRINSSTPLVLAKDLIKENFSLVGGLITTPALNRGSGGIGLSDIVEDIYGTQEKVSAKEIKEAMGTFSKMGNLLHREENLKEIASSLSEIATKAKTYTLSETDDWFSNSLSNACPSQTANSPSINIFI